MKRSLLVVWVLLGGLVGFFAGQWVYADSLSDLESRGKTLYPLTIESAEGEERAMFEVAVAADAAERTEGLQIVSRLRRSEGMWFVFEDEAVRHFWMKDMVIALDILFVNAKFEVVSVVESALPCREEDPAQTDCPTYASVEPAQYVLELSAGSIERLGLLIGDRVVPPNF